MMSSLGQQAVDAVFDAMQVDRQWSMRTSRGFCWWPHRLAQDVSASEPVISKGFEVTKVTVSTEVVREVLETSRIYQLLATINQQASLYSTVFDFENGLVR